MNIRNVLETATKAQSASRFEVELEGWLVVINDELYLLEEELPEDYKQAVKIKISDRNIIYPVRQAILPLGGGESFVFHKAKVNGFLTVEVPVEIVVKNLRIQERGELVFLPIDITQNAIAAAKACYESALNFDFFKEMGDT